LRRARPEDVESGTARRSVCAKEDAGTNERGHGEADVDEHAPAPVEVLNEDAAEQQPYCGFAAGQGGVDPECAGAAPGIGERSGQQGERGGCHDCPERSLEGARNDEHRKARRGAARGRGGAEADQPDNEHPLAAEQVAQPSAEQEKAAERERVGRHRPLAVSNAEPERALRGRQRDVHDQDVQRDHQLGQAERGEDPTASGPMRGSLRPVGAS
jgi:hypothetical protein